MSWIGIIRRLWAFALAIFIPLIFLLLSSFGILGFDYLLHIAILCGIYVILSVSLDIIVGMAGLLNLGHVAFYAIGAYITALLSLHFGLNFFISALVSAAASGVCGLLLGIPTLRLRGDYLAIVTLGFGEILRITLNNWDSLTNGPRGLMGISHPSIGGFVIERPLHFYYLVLFLVAISIALYWRIERTRIGRALVAIREDEIAAASVGIDVTKLKLFAFWIGASLAGLAGSFFASWTGFVSPDSFTFMESVLILCMVVLGGMGNVLGVSIGAIVLSSLPELLREFRDYRMLFFGLLLIVMLAFRPEGIVKSKRRAMELKRG